jgi:hypothetical protein
MLLNATAVCDQKRMKTRVCTRDIHNNTRISSNHPRFVKLYRFRQTALFGYTKTLYTVRKKWGAKNARAAGDHWEPKIGVPGDPQSQL